MRKKLPTYWTLFSSAFLLSAFTFGGGYVIVPLMKKKYVNQLKWIEEEEMLNMIAIAQSSPGPIAVNTAIMVGYKIAGVLGAALSTIGTVLPPLIILTVVSFFYQEFRDNMYISAMLKGMQAGVSAVIVDVVIGLSGNVIKKKEIFSIIMMITAFIAVFFFKVNVIIVILASGLIGMLMFLYRTRKGGMNHDLH
ncbi:MAG: chromate transporter [Clostridiales bacterium]|jgi:chromate transporter|nr:chromate transporter [Clostridiales bacterium]